VYAPTARQLVAEAHETLTSVARTAAGILGIDSRAQALPFHASAITLYAAVW
jgi:hypothetical protein